MKKGFFIVLFLLASVFAFSEELNGFNDIFFGTSKTAVIALMEGKGYTPSSPSANVVSFSKENETFLNTKVKEYRFYFNSSNNKFISYTMILDKNGVKQPFKEAPLYIQGKYNCGDSEIISNNAIFCCKISMKNNEATVVLIDTYTNEYVINFYSYNRFLDFDIL